MTWQARLTFVLLVLGLALTARIYDAPGRLRAWYWRHRRSWRKAPPSEFGQFSPLEWQDYRRKNPGAW